MKTTLLILLFAVTAIIYVDCKQRPIPFLSRKIESSYLPRDDPKCPETGSGKLCNADCSGIIVCNNGKPVGTLNCATQTGNKRPYCNNDTLTCDASPEHCGTSGPTEKCEFEGFYPDLLKCKLFYDCEVIGEQPILYNCDGNAVYNPKTEICQYGLTCYDFSNNGLCKGKIYTFIVHPLDKKFYIFCTDSAPMINRCEGSIDKLTDVYEFDPTTASCEYVCLKAGRYSNLYDQSKNSYYECSPNGNTFIKSLKKCPKDYIFEVNKCIKMIPPTTKSPVEGKSGGENYF